jgi:hypothetical protein
MSRAPIFAGAALGATAALAFVAADAQDSSPSRQHSAQVTAPEIERVDHTMPAPQGQPVTFRYGSGINHEGIDSAVRVVTAGGCQASATADGIPGTVFARTNGQAEMFDDAREAAAWALDNCK